MDERDYVKRARKGDAEAFGKLYEGIYKDLYRYALYTLRNTQDAEDAVSEAVEDAFAAIHGLKKEESFDHWMKQILVNKCKRKMRDYYKPEDSLDQPEMVEETGSIAGTAAGKNGSDEHMEEIMDVRESFFRLDGRDRCILSMHLFFGYKTREIAGLLEMNENTVRTRESRALKRLREMLR